MNLLLAIYYEHQQRTRHDAFSTLPPTMCDVCLMLRAEKRDYDRMVSEAEIDYAKGLIAREHDR